MHWRSREILERPEWALNRALYKSMGFTDKDIDKPLIAIANSWNTICSGSFPLKEIAQYVKTGIIENGGTPLEFGTIGACDGLAQGHEGMRYILPTRDLIANDIEMMVQAHRLDGIVLLGSCDKIIPGMLMAAVRLDIPAILVNAGPMLAGKFKKENPYGGENVDSSAVQEGLAILESGKITEDEYKKLEDTACPTPGSCSMLGTANTMACLTEALGMSLTGSAVIPPVYADRLKVASESGRKIMMMVKEGITARDIITEKAVDNAVRVNSAIGGSTNSVLHIPAIAYEAEIDFNIEKFEQLSNETPYIATMMPASKYDVAAFNEAGGVPAVMNQLKHDLYLDCLTVTGDTVGENIKDAYIKDKNVIRSSKDPFRQHGGIAVLKGNLSPHGCITKPAAIPDEVMYFKGKAVVFNSQAEAIQGIKDEKIRAGDVVVIRYEGPKGGPGMPEMFKPLKLLTGRGLRKKVALITDGRFSGSNNGCFAGHISPEAAEGGPLAIVEDGDEIIIDVRNRNIELNVTETEINRRLQQWERPPRRIKRGYLALYSRLVESADKGAIFKY